MRKLARLETIEAIRPIPNADAIEVAVIGGWDVVVKKGEFAANDEVVYCEYDSWIPNTIAPFLTKGVTPRIYNGVPGERLRTVKLRGQVSQGLILNKSVLNGHSVVIGDDVSELLGIQLYEPPVHAQLQGLARGNFPSCIRKTDQERFQNILAKIHQSIEDNDEYEITLKLDGSSFTAYEHEGHIGICSRNLELKFEGNEQNSYVKMFHEGNFSKIFEQFQGIAIQGELMGPGIQKNREDFAGACLFVFDIFDIKRGQYMSPIERKEVFKRVSVISAARINHVPVLGQYFLKDLVKHETLKEDLLKLADRGSLNHRVAEGLVFKRIDGQFSFKVINNRFLLNEK